LKKGRDKDGNLISSVSLAAVGVVGEGDANLIGEKH